MSPPDLTLLAIPILVAGAVLSVVVGRGATQTAMALGTQIIGCALVLVAVIPIAAGASAVETTWDWPAPIGAIVFRVDALSAFFLLWSLPMTLGGTVYALGYLRPQLERGRNAGPHLALLNLTSVAFVLVYSVQNALVFLLGWEIAAVSAWLLVIWDYRNQRIRFAGFNYLVSTHVGLFVLVAAFMLLHSRTGSMDFAAFGAFLSQPSKDRAMIFALLGVSFALKSAFFPFHTWLPRAHSAAPAHVSALMSGVIHKAGLFGFLRFTLLAGRPEEWMGWTLLVFGLLSAFFGVIYTAAQRDLKRLLGYSSTENVGIVAAAFGVGYLGWTWNDPTLAVVGFTAGVLHILNHAVFKCLLFYAAGSIYRVVHSVDLERLGGVAHRLPAVAALFLVGGLGMCGLPPLNGFVSELLLYAGCLSGRAPTTEGDVVLVCAAAVLAFVGAMAALSIVRAFGLTFLGTPRDPNLHAHAHGHVPRTMTGTMWVHAVLVLALGVVPELALTVVEPVVSDLTATVPGATTATVDGMLEGVVWASRVLAGTLAVALAFTWRRAAKARRSAIWGCGYTAGSSRMQYTGRSFAAQMTDLLRPALPVLERAHLPEGPFPAGNGHLSTHHVDAVERRMFEVLGQGEDFVHDAAERIPEQPRFAFLAGLVAVVVVAIVALGRGS